MMKKMILGISSAVLILGLGTMTAFASGHGSWYPGGHCAGLCAVYDGAQCYNRDGSAVSESNGGTDAAADTTAPSDQQSAATRSGQQGSAGQIQYRQYQHHGYGHHWEHSRCH